MTYSKKFDTVKKYYDLKMWDETRVRNAVVKNWITAAEFEEIVGKEY